MFVPFSDSIDSRNGKLIAPDPDNNRAMPIKETLARIACPIALSINGSPGLIVAVYSQDDYLIFCTHAGQRPVGIEPKEPASTAAGSPVIVLKFALHDIEKCELMVLNDQPCCVRRSANDSGGLSRRDVEDLLWGSKKARLLRQDVMRFRELDSCFSRMKYPSIWKKIREKYSNWRNAQVGERLTPDIMDAAGMPKEVARIIGEYAIDPEEWSPIEPEIDLVQALSLRPLVGEKVDGDGRPYFRHAIGAIGYIRLPNEERLRVCIFTSKLVSGSRVLSAWHEPIVDGERTLHQTVGVTRPEYFAVLAHYQHLYLKDGSKTPVLFPLSSFWKLDEFDGLWKGMARHRLHDVLNMLVNVPLDALLEVEEWRCENEEQLDAATKQLDAAYEALEQRASTPSRRHDGGLIHYPRG